MNENKLQEIREKLKETQDPVLKESLELFLKMYSILNADCNMGNSNDKWLDGPEACRFLKISSRTLQNYRDKGILPFSQIGSKIYFKQSDIENMLIKHYRNY